MLTFSHYWLATCALANSTPAWWDTSALNRKASENANLSFRFIREGIANRRVTGNQQRGDESRSQQQQQLGVHSDRSDDNPLCQNWTSDVWKREKKSRTVLQAFQTVKIKVCQPCGSNVQLFGPSTPEMNWHSSRIDQTNKRIPLKCMGIRPLNWWWIPIRLRCRYPFRECQLEPDTWFAHLCLLKAYPHQRRNDWRIDGTNSWIRGQIEPMHCFLWGCPHWICNLSPNSFMNQKSDFCGRIHTNLFAEFMNEFFRLPCEFALNQTDCIVGTPSFPFFSDVSAALVLHEPKRTLLWPLGPEEQAHGTREENLPCQPTSVRAQWVKQRLGTKRTVWRYHLNTRTSYLSTAGVDPGCVGWGAPPLENDEYA